MSPCLLCGDSLLGQENRYERLWLDANAPGARQGRKAAAPNKIDMKDYGSNGPPSGARKSRTSGKIPLRLMVRAVIESVGVPMTSAAIRTAIERRYREQGNDATSIGARRRGLGAGSGLRGAVSAQALAVVVANDRRAYRIGRANGTRVYVVHALDELCERSRGWFSLSSWPIKQRIVPMRHEGEALEIMVAKLRGKSKGRSRAFDADAEKAAKIARRYSEYDSIFGPDTTTAVKTARVTKRRRKASP